MNRYAKFCKDNSEDLQKAFASLPRSASADATTNPPANRARKTDTRQKSTPPASSELSVILLSLRKLREAITATVKTTPAALTMDVFIFCVRTALLAAHPPSYFPALRFLVEDLKPRNNAPHAASMHEFVTYLILDYACRQGELGRALQLLDRAKETIAYRNDLVDRTISALIHDDWVTFWRIKSRGNGYIRCLMDWSTDSMQLRALGAIGKAYVSVDIDFLIKSCTGEENGCTWEELVKKHDLGWGRQNGKVVIKARKPGVDITKPSAA